MGFENSGRRPKSTAWHALHGNPSRKHLHPEPVPAGEAVKPALSAGAGAVWDRLAPVCQGMGTLTAADVPAFAKLCELEATAAAVARLKDAPGFAILKGRGVHPLIALERATASQLRPYYDYFGMTPTGRARLAAPQAPAAPVSKWAGLK